MIISAKTIEKLRNLINEETEYRSGSKLVAFFNRYGFTDSYGNGFPSRWIFTDSRLNAINGTPELDKCIKDLFAPINFIGRFADLDKFIAEFNLYLSFDGWKVQRTGQMITLVKSNGVDIDTEIRNQTVLNESDFLNEQFRDIYLQSLPIDSVIIPFFRRSYYRNQAIYIC